MNTLSSSSPSSTVYKGKVAHRSWPQLPDELVRHIATFYLWDLSATNYCPQVWDARELWHPRMVYTALRDAVDLEKLMSICPQWSLALEIHLFWQQAVTLIDPLDFLAHHAIVQPLQYPQQQQQAKLAPGSAAAAATHIVTQSQASHASRKPQPPPSRLTPYRHFRNIMSCSCIVCRINSPTTSMGLTLARRTLSTPYLGAVGLCREHERRKLGFCGLCLREGCVFEGGGLGTLAVGAGNPNMNGVNTPMNVNGIIQGYGVMGLTPIQQQSLMTGCLENEDEDTFPGVHATCRSCRHEHLWVHAMLNPMDVLALGGTPAKPIQRSTQNTMTVPTIPPLTAPLNDSLDWETRQVVEGFVELAEGGIKDVLSVAREKWWLRRYTRLGDMLGQALAAQKFNSGVSTVATVGQKRPSAPHGPTNAKVDRRSGANGDLQVGHKGKTNHRRGRRKGQGPGGFIADEFSDEEEEDVDDDRTSESYYSGSEDLDDGGDVRRAQSPRQAPRRQPQRTPVRAGSPNDSAYDGYYTSDSEGGHGEVADLQGVEEEQEEEEEDPELLQLTEESGVRDLALGDWARTRILDGFWISPADLWYGYSVPGRKAGSVKAVHPVPWAREEQEEEEARIDRRNGQVTDLEGGEQDQHPKPSTIQADVPPSYSLCEQAYQAHQQQMRVVLLPPMKNIVRRLVMECQEAAGWTSPGPVGRDSGIEDPAMKATKMSLEAVGKVLREEEGVWFDGVDWAERRRNERIREQECVGPSSDSEPERCESSSSPAASSPSSSLLDHHHQEGGNGGPRDGAASTTSSGPGSGSGSVDTSPVLSTTTLQTTPSPPPLLVDGKLEGESGAGAGVDIDKGTATQSQVPSQHHHERQPGSGTDQIKDEGRGAREPAARVVPSSSAWKPPMIPISPVLDPPRLLRPIPFVPTTLAHLPQYSLEAFKLVWREACAPLYHCRCKICERAVAKANADATRAAGGVVVPNGNAVVPKRESAVVRDEANVVQLKEVGDEEHERLVAEAEEEEEDVDERGRRRYEEEEEEDLDPDDEECDLQYPDDYEDEERGADEDGYEAYSPPPSLTQSSPQSRIMPSKKRSVSAMQDEDHLSGRPLRLRDGGSPETTSSDRYSDVTGSDTRYQSRNQRDGTPPKRARRSTEEEDADGNDVYGIASPSRRVSSGVTAVGGSAVVGGQTVMSPPGSPNTVRMRKRSSEELEEGERVGNEPGTPGSVGIKRLKVAEGGVPKNVSLGEETRCGGGGGTAAVDVGRFSSFELQRTSKEVLEMEGLYVLEGLDE